MDKITARRLGPLLHPDVQNALAILIDYRINLKVKDMVSTDSDRHMYQSQGAIKELEWLKNSRDTIIQKAE